MRVSYINMAMPVYKQKQENFRNSISETSSLSGFSPNFTSKYSSFNKTLTRWVNEAFELGDVSKLLRRINQRTVIKPIFNPDTTKGVSVKIFTKKGRSRNFPVDELMIKSDGFFIDAHKNGHTQIGYEGKNLLIEKGGIRKNQMPLREQKIILGGERRWTPCNQEDWPEVWPPAESTWTEKGVVTLSFDKTHRAIFANPTEEVNRAYQTNPKGITILDTDNNSTIWICQQEVHNPQKVHNRRVKFGPWSILPFKLKEGKKTSVIMPISKKTAKKYRKGSKDFKEMKDSGQWSVIEDKNKKNFFMVDVSKPSPKSEYMDPDADWFLVATEGDKDMYLVRSCYNDHTPERKIKIYSEKKEGGGTKYFEGEPRGPRVGDGKTSTLVYRMERISSKELGIESLTRENMDEMLQKAGGIIEGKVAKLRKQFYN